MFLCIWILFSTRRFSSLSAISNGGSMKQRWCSFHHEWNIGNAELQWSQSELPSDTAIFSFNKLFFHYFMSPVCWFASVIDFECVHLTHWFPEISFFLDDGMFAGFMFLSFWISLRFIAGPFCSGCCATLVLIVYIVFSASLHRKSLASLSLISFTHVARRYDFNRSIAFRTVYSWNLKRLKQILSVQSTVIKWW